MILVLNLISQKKNYLYRQFLYCLFTKTFQVRGMNSFGDKIVFAQIKDGRDQLIALNTELKQAFEAAGFDCEERYTPHVTVIKVR